jgi:uncharacterized protein DUF4157
MYAGGKISPVAKPVAMHHTLRTPVRSAQVMAAAGTRFDLSRISIAAPQQIQRACAACDKADEEQVARRAESSQDELVPGAAPAIVGDVLGSSSGRALDADTRAYFEPRFGHDFGSVRVHDDARADASARSVRALAYTVGSQVVFRTGRFSPASGDGRRLLAHELAHVVQQSGASAGASSGRALSTVPANDRGEREADRVAAAVIASPDRRPPTAGLSAPAVARVADEKEPEPATAMSPAAVEAASGAADGAAADPPDKIEYTTQGPQPTDPTSELSTGAATGGPEITLETGNVGASPVNNAVHQQICASTGADAGRQCFSFAANGSLQAPEFSTTWLGWNSIVAGAILNGEIYHPGPVPGATIVSRHTPTAAQAARWLSYMSGSRLGLKDGYSVARHNCRTFSQWEFRDAPSHW